MLGMVRAAGLFLTLISGFGIAGLGGFAGTAAAQDVSRRVISTPNADYPGHDYRTVRGVDAALCEATCLGENLCRAFTYNQSARWCFLKSDFGPLAVAENAVAGRVVETAVLTATAESARLSELQQLMISSSLIDDARRFANTLGNVYFPGSEGYAALREQGFSARRLGDENAAANALGRALALATDDPLAWIEYALATLERTSNDYNVQQDIRQQAASAAINAYLRSTDEATRADALAAIGASMEMRSAWRQSIRSYRASLVLAESRGVRATLDRVVAEHGFRILNYEVDADAASPRICVIFSDQIPSTQPGLADFVTVTGGEGLSIEPEPNQICIDGVQHGGNYHIRVREGFPSWDEEKLLRTAELDVFVRDRAPWVGFAGNAYVVPAGRGASIPMVSINTPAAEATIYRIGDRALYETVRNGSYLRDLQVSDAEEIAYTTGEQVWEGTVSIASELNQQVTTAIPIEEALTELRPGIYVITARVPDTETEYWDSEATQWFIVSDLGLASMVGNDGVHAFVRSLGSAEAVAGVTVRLVAVNNEVLGEVTTDAAGYAHFGAGLARGTGGNAPQMVVAETPNDYAFLDLNRSGFDLTDRGVEGRPSPGPLDVYATTERGIYRPGETVFMTALVRDSLANAVPNLPITIVVERPDGVEAARATVNDQGLGGYLYTIILRDDAMRGSWRMSLFSDPDDSALTGVNFLVEDFEPERLAFEVSTDANAFAVDAPTLVDIEARYLYGATAPFLAVEGEIAVTPVSTLAAFAGYTFGRLDESMETIRQPIDAYAETDEQGLAQLEVSLPELPASTRLFTAQAIFSITDTNGRAVTRGLSLPVTAAGPRIGIRELFDDGAAPEGGAAQFDLIAVSPAGERIAMPGVAWSLLKVETQYQWYSTNGRWNWESVETTRRVADGTVDIGADVPAQVSAGVEWGEYRLEVTSSGDDATSSSTSFYAGWYVADVGTNTPDVLEVALDKQSYRIGETVQLRLNPRFAGTALVTVVDDRLISMHTVAVPEGGATTELQVTTDWGPGAYVVATLYRPMDIEAKRMPARALGLSWAEVEPGDRDLNVVLDLPSEQRPRGPLTIPVSISNLAPGTEAYIAVAAVDLGILNLTNYDPPAPEKWYFGQRQLGMDIRDLYGALIDRMQGTPGALRTGGDGESRSLGATPPTQKLLAYHSGIVRVDFEGKATVTFQVPDFNGTVRVMVQAWSAAGVGSAVKDLFVRDPVVVATSVPRFLHAGDTSRLLVEFTNVSGAPGDYRLEVDADAGIGLRAEDGNHTIALAAEQRATIALPITGDAVGDHEVRLVLVTPGGERLLKDFQLGVRPAGLPTPRRDVIAMSPNGTLTLDASLVSEFVPGTASVTLAAGAAARLDIPEILYALDRYPYGCAEQLTSRALPLLYLDEVAAAVGMGRDEAITARIQNAIAGVLSKQASNGGFGLWGPYDDGDFWLNAYVTDFLTRASALGYDVPALAQKLALDSLSNRLAYASDFSNGGEDIAYALYVLARNGRAAIGDLRYYAEEKINAFATPLAKAQVGAALALYGDRIRSARAFEAAVVALNNTSADYRRGWRSDYGSPLRDEAAVLTLVAESGEPGVNLRDLANRVAASREARRYTSTQEDAWTLLAAAALLKDLDQSALTVAGEPIEGSVFRSYDEAELAAAPITVVNVGLAPVDAVVTAVGVPRELQPESGDGFKIERTYYTPDGTLADVATVGQNDRFVVTLTVTATDARYGRLLVVDPLPAGFEIENPNLSVTGEVSRYPWLTAEQYIEHSESRTDRFVAALTRSESDGLQFVVAYVVRAVSPGVFVHAGAVVEDMYRPERRANSAPGQVEVVGATQ